MRRIPELKNDSVNSFPHLTTGEEITVMTPVKEELFANKFATMISRSKTYLNQRDIFDVYSLSKEVFDNRLFLELVVIEVMLMNIPLDILFQTESRLITGKTSGHLQHLINQSKNFKTIQEEVSHFTVQIINDIIENKMENVIETFYKTGKVDITSFQNHDLFNPRLSEHPQFKWLRKKRENKN